MHKCAAIAKLRSRQGPWGVRAERWEEAEILAAAGVADIFISNEIVAPSS